MASLLSRIGLVPLVLAGFRLCAADDLPTRAPGEVPGAEPRLMLDDLPDLTLPAPATPGEIADVSVERAQAELARARRKQQSWQKLAKAGVLSQVEAESTTLQVARALVKYQTALAAQAAAQVAQLRVRREQGGIAPEELAAAEAAQRSTAALAAEAAAQLQRQQHLAAAANLDRQRSLFALGIGTRAHVQRAQAAVERLSENPAPK